MFVTIAVVLSVALGGTLPAQRLSPPQSAQAGWDALNAGRAQDALAAFEDALRAAPRDSRLLLGAGAAAHALGQSDAARRYLTEALRSDPALTNASLLLGQVLYRANDVAAAIDVYEKALVHAPGHRLMSERLEAWRKESSLHERFGQKLGDHFTVLFEGPAEAALAQKAVEILEAAYWRIGAALYTYPTEVITVVLYTREQFRDVTRSPEWAGASFDGRIRVPVRGALQNTRDFERVLSHELAHAFVRATAVRGVPVWLNEGLAMAFDGTDVDAMAARLERTHKRLDIGVLGRSLDTLGSEDAALAYAQSAVAVRTLIREAGAAAVVAILTDLARGVDFREALEHRANLPYTDFLRRAFLGPQG